MPAPAALTGGARQVGDPADGGGAPATSHASRGKWDGEQSAADGGGSSASETRRRRESETIRARSFWRYNVRSM